MEAAFLMLVNRFGSKKSPKAFQRVFLPKEDMLTERWLSSRNLGWSRVMGACYATLIILSIGCLICLSLALFLPGLSTPLLLPPFLLFPITVVSILANIPKWFARREEKAIVPESPRIVSMITMNMQSCPNLERAILFVSNRGDGILASRLRWLRWKVLTRGEKDMLSAVMSFSAMLSESNDGLRQALHLVISANFERTTEGIERMLDKANQVILESLKESVDRYASSLSVPTMLLFSIGVILPVMMFALLPLLSMGSIASESSYASGVGQIDEGEIALVMLVAFPTFCFLCAHRILDQNPIRSIDDLELRDHRYLLAAFPLWILALVLVWAAFTDTYGSYIFLMTVVLPPSILLILKFRGDRDGGKNVRMLEGEFANALYRIGNRMRSGSSFESAFMEAAKSMKGSHFSSYARRAIHLSRVSRNPLGQLVGNRELLNVESPLIEAAIDSFAECAQRDPQAAGKVALNLAQNMNDIRRGEALVEERLKGIVDMMRTTAVLFAPIVLGITSSLFGVIGVQTGSPLYTMDGIVLIVGTYLIELNLMIAYFTTFLMREGGWREVGFQSATKIPISILAYILTSILSINGMLFML
jgi:hypothetical protein